MLNIGIFHESKVMLKLQPVFCIRVYDSELGCRVPLSRSTGRLKHAVRLRVSKSSYDLPL